MNIELVNYLKLSSPDNRFIHLYQDFLDLCRECADEGLPVEQFPLLDKTFPVTEYEVSWGTLNPQDLYCAFLFEFFNRGHYRTLYLYYKDMYNEVMSHMVEEHESPIPNDPRFWDWDYLTEGEMGEWVENVLYEMAEKLDAIAPKGFYFGTHEGDGSLFGYWQVGE